MKIGLFGGWDYPTGLCGQTDSSDVADDGGVPMGGVLKTAPAGAKGPTFYAQAQWDPGTAGKPGSKLAQLQIIKGWIGADGKVREKVVGVAGKADGGLKAADVETIATGCKAPAGGHESLCAVWRDGDYEAGQRAFWYARVVELPSCRWSTRACLKLAEKDRPGGCSDKSVRKVVRQRAWSSPIWSVP